MPSLTWPAMARDGVDKGESKRALVQCWGVADDGVAVEVVVHHTIADALIERWPPRGLEMSARPDGPISHHISVTRVDANGGQGPSWDRLESELALFASERLTGLVAVHAAVIVHGSRALIVPGTSGAGKSTLCAAAHAVGATILSDEYALVDPVSGLVMGWRRAVRIRRDDGGAERLDIATESDPVPAGLIALVTHDGASEPSWAGITGAEAVLGLLANTVCAQSRPDDALDAALALAGSTSAVAGRRGEASESIAQLLDLLANGKS